MKISTNKEQIILASTSKTRKKILENYSVKIKCVKHQVNEELEILKNKNLKEKLAIFLAKKKIDSILDEYQKNVIIGSDQIILCKDRLINKPLTEEEAINNLLILQDSSHTLISAICVLTPDGQYQSFEDTAEVCMKKLSEAEIKKFVNTHKNIVYETTGSYKIEEDKLNCIKKTKGEKETILGFPIKKILPLLKMYY